MLDADPVGAALAARQPRRRRSPRSSPSSPSASATSASRRTWTTEQARFRLFDSFAGFLAGASGVAAAGASSSTTCTGPTSRRCCCCASSPARLADTGLLLIGTYRDVELGRHHPLAETLGELAGVDGRGASRCTASRPKGIADYIELTAGRRPPAADLADAIREQTGGNPFFIGEVVRLMAAEGRLGEAGGAAARWRSRRACAR